MHKLSLLACLLLACGDQGPTHPLVVEDAGTQLAASHDGGAPQKDAASSEADAGSGSRSDASVFVQEVGPDTGYTGTGCEALPFDCPAHTYVTVDIHGTSPSGPVHVTQLDVSYLRGDAAMTFLTARGELAGQAFEITAEVDGGNRPPPLSPACPPGLYRSDLGPTEQNAMSAVLYLCAARTELHRAELRVDQHDVPQPDGVRQAGDAVRFLGNLTISDPGWDLQIPFTLEAACSVGVII